MRSDNTLLQQARISAVTAWIDGVTLPFHQPSGREWNRLIFRVTFPEMRATLANAFQVARRRYVTHAAGIFSCCPALILSGSAMLFA